MTFLTSLPKLRTCDGVTLAVTRAAVLSARWKEGFGEEKEEAGRQLESATAESLEAATKLQCRFGKAGKLTSRPLAARCSVCLPV